MPSHSSDRDSRNDRRGSSPSRSTRHRSSRHRSRSPDDRRGSPDRERNSERSRRRADKHTSNDTSREKYYRKFDEGDPLYRNPPSSAPRYNTQSRRVSRSKSRSRSRSPRGGRGPDRFRDRFNGPGRDQNRNRDRNSNRSGGPPPFDQSESYYEKRLEERDRIKFNLWERFPSPSPERKPNKTLRSEDHTVQNEKKKKKEKETVEPKRAESSSGSSSSGSESAEDRSALRKKTKSRNRGKSKSKSKSKRKEMSSSRSKKKRSSKRRNRSSSPSSSSSSSSGSDSDSNSDSDAAVVDSDTKVKTKAVDEEVKDEDHEHEEEEEMDETEMLEAAKFKAAVQNQQGRNGDDNEDDADIGPQPLAETGDASKKSMDYGKALLPGEGQAIAQFVQKNMRIPRRGEVGWQGEEISDLETLGYVMSGSRHTRMNAIRIRKENQVYSAEEKRALALINFEEKQQRENQVMQDFREMLQARLSKKHGADRAEDMEHAAMDDN